MNVKVKGIDGVLKGLDKYSQRIAEAEKTVPQAACERGKQTADMVYTFMEYAGDPIIPVVNVTPSQNGCDLIATGDGLLFGEFGTGTFYPDHPRQDLVLARGTFGEHRGANPPWLYKGPPGNMGMKSDKKDTLSVTYGTHATPGMYEASQTIRAEREKIFKEVLNNG